MTYTIEMGSDGIYILSFIKIGWGIQRMLEGDTWADTQKHKQQGDLISLLLFFKSKVNRLKIVACISKCPLPFMLLYIEFT
jgi:hypothetical protein